MGQSQAESELSRKIKAALNARGHRVWKNHGTQYVEKGMADLAGVSRLGRGIALEVKMPGKEISGLSPDQYKWLARYVESSPLAICSVVSSVQQAIAAVETAGAFALVTPDTVLMVPVDSLPAERWKRIAALIAENAALTYPVGSG